MNITRQAMFHDGKRLQSASFIAPIACLMFLILSKLPFAPALTIDVEIGVYFIPLFIWARQSTSFIAPICVFFFGLLHDVLSGAPFGLWAVLFCLFFGFVRSQAHILSTHFFYFRWFVFILSIFLTYLLIYIIGLLRSDYDFAGVTAFVSFGLLSFIYGPVAFILEFVITRFGTSEMGHV